MSDLDDPLEAALRESLERRTEDLHVPEGLAQGAIRRARRRTARRAAVIGVPALVAVAVLVVLVSGGGARSTAVPHFSMRDARAVVRRVSARIKELGASDGVFEFDSVRGTGGAPVNRAFSYTDPRSGTEYLRQDDTRRSGYDSVMWQRTTLLAPRRVRNVAYWITPDRKTYWVQRRVYGVHPLGVPSIEDTPAQITRFLDTGGIRLAGETTTSGRRALHLTLRPKGLPETISLYVNARTYQPIEEVQTFFTRGGRVSVTDRSYVLPVTAANIARAETRPDLSGYRRTRSG